MTNDLRRIIAKRIAIHPEYDLGIKRCWKEALNFAKDNSEAVVLFVNNDATDEEVYWLSEILCDMYDLLKDDRIIDAFQERANKMDDTEMKRSILQEIDYI
ncbi:MAG: hypothetical protein K6C35_00735 [Eubacterium sp.]|nr:hypothetical protein [Eubacterium sp.]